MEEESETAERKKALSLANDVELMAKLSALSERIAVRSNDVKNSIIHLGRESKEAAVETQNSLNRFLMLCNIQFVENRVYEEDEEEKKEEDTEKTKTVVMDEASRHARALRLGLAALNEIPEEDIYNSRPLPYIFGTSAYLESDSAGIGDEIQEDKEDVNQEYHIDANTYEQEGQVEEYDDAEPMSSHISYNEEQEEKEPSLFDGDDDLHQGMRQSKAPPPMPSSVPPMPSGDLFGSGGDDYDDLFGAASIIEDRSSTIFGGRSSLLFYDDDENENESEEPTPKQTKQIDDDSGNLFATDDVIQDFNAASAFAGQAPVSERKKRSVPETRVKLPGLFEDDDDTFIPQSTKQKEEDTVIVPESMESHKGLAARGLFDDDDDDDDIDKLLASDSSKLFEAPIFEEDTEKEIQDEEPASTNSGLGDLFSKTSLFDDDEETSTKKTSKKSGVGLFTDDDSDDIFAFPSSRSSASKKNSRDMFSEDKNDLFTSQGDDPIFGDKISGLIFADNENKSSAARKLPGLFASTDSPSLFDERSKDESSVSAANSDMNKNTGDLFANDDDLPTTKNSSQLFADDKPIVLSNSKESKPIQKNKIDKFAGLDIDPTRMLPGARPPPRKSVPEASDEVTDHHALSESNESSIDNSVISSRPIISNKKRRASRKTKFVSQTETPGLEEKLQSTPAIHSVTDLFADNVQDVPASVLSAPVPASSQKKTSGGLFADEEPDLKPTKKSSLYSAEDSQLSEPVPASSQKKTSGGLFADDEPDSKPTKKNSLFTAEDSQLSAPVPAPTQEKTSGGLFADDEPDPLKSTSESGDLFTAVPVSSPKPTATPTKSSLFSKEEITESNSVFFGDSKKSVSSLAKKGLFDDDDDNDDFFGATKSKKVTDKSPSLTIKKGLFDDDDDDLFGSKKTGKRSGGGLFDD